MFFLLIIMNMGVSNNVGGTGWVPKFCPMKGLTLHPAGQGDKDQPSGCAGAGFGLARVGHKGGSHTCAPASDFWQLCQHNTVVDSPIFYALAISAFVKFFCGCRVSPAHYVIMRRTLCPSPPSLIRSGDNFSAPDEFH